MKKSRHFFLILNFISFILCSPTATFCQSQCISSSTIGTFFQKIKNALAQSVKNSPIFSSIALYTLLFQRNLIEEHPYITALIGTDLLANFLYNYSKSTYSTNSFAQTISKHPISCALILYTLIFNQDLAINHPLITTFLLGTIAYAWAENSQQQICNEKPIEVYEGDMVMVDGISLKGNSVIFVSTI
jgi:hypothetical protein